MILHIRIVRVEDGDGDDNDDEVWGDVDVDVDEWCGGILWWGYSTLWYDSYDYDDSDTPYQDKITRIMMMILLHIRMAREEGPLGKFLLLRVQHTLYSEYQHY